MCSTQFSRNKTLLAATLGAIGAGVLAGVAGYLIYNIVEEKKKVKNLQQDLARLELSLSELYQEFLELRDSLFSNNNKQSTSSSSTRSRRNLGNSSRTGHETEDDFFTAFDSDEEFHDLDSEDENTLTLQEDSERESEASKIFEEVDILMKGNDEDRLRALSLLKNNEFKMSENPDFLWRCAKAYQMQALVSEAKKDLESKKKYVYKGLDYATKALKLDADNPDAHKWFAILTGMQTEFLSIKEKIQNGYLFHKHVLIALETKPEDYSLHYLLGRFKFELASTSWFERKVAASLFAELPNFTYSDAINDLLQAEKLNSTPWKENRLLLAKCFIGEGKYDVAVKWLNSAKEITPKIKEDEACDQEVNVLLKNYMNY